MQILNAVTVLFLGINMIQDIRKREILPGITALFLIGGAIWKLFMIHTGIFDLTCGLIPGFVLLILGRMSRGSVGYGDGMVILALGVSAGLWKTVESLSIGFLLSAAAALLIWCKKKNKNQKIPFIPFLFLGYLGSSV